MLTAETIIPVLAHYDLGELRDCRYIDHGVVSNPWWVETTTGEYFFRRRYRDRSRPEVVKAQHALIQHLRNSSFPAPAIVPTRSGTSFVELRGDIYEIHHFVRGELCDVSKRAHFTAAASTLAWYHHSVQGFDHPDLHRPRERYGPTALRETLEQLTEDWRGRTDAHLDHLIAELKQHCHDLVYRFGSFGELPELIIHGDYYADNLIFAGDSVAGVVDYDLAHWCSRAMELAEALIFFSTERPARLKHIVYAGMLDLDAVRRFLATYTETSRLSESEIYALPHFIRTIWLCASLAPPLRPRLSFESAPHALPEILTLADWARSHTQDIIAIGLATRH